MKTKITWFDYYNATTRHEAAHAVVAAALHIDVVSMSAIGDKRLKNAAGSCWTRDRAHFKLGEHIAVDLAGYYQEKIDGNNSARDAAVGDLENVATLKRLYHEHMLCASYATWYGSWWRFFLHWARVSKKMVRMYQDDILRVASDLVMAEGKMGKRQCGWALADVQQIDYSEIHFERVAQEAA